MLNKSLKVTSLVIFTVLLIAVLVSGSAGYVLTLDCHEDAVLFKENGSHTVPPNEKCWGWYRGHLYPISSGPRGITPVLEGPIQVTALSARITGGPSELNKKVSGFEIQVLPVAQISNSDETRRGLTAITPEVQWKTLVTFSAPCDSGPEVLVHWEGPPVEVAALRVVAPDGNYVDRSGLWVEHEH